MGSCDFFLYSLCAFQINPCVRFADISTRITLVGILCSGTHPCHFVQLMKPSKWSLNSGIDSLILLILSTLQIQPMRAFLLECKDNPGLGKYSKVHIISILLYYFSTVSYISGFIH